MEKHITVSLTDLEIQFTDYDGALDRIEQYLSQQESIDEQFRVEINDWCGGEYIDAYTTVDVYVPLYNGMGFEVDSEQYREIQELAQSATIVAWELEQQDKGEN